MKSTIIVSVSALLVFMTAAHADTQKRTTSSLEGGDGYVHTVSYQPKYREMGRSSFPSRIKAHGERLFFFSPKYKEWAAYSADGRLIGYGRANGGAHYCKDTGRACRTPRGMFRVFSKGQPGCRSGKYPLPKGGAPMPYCMFFLSGYAIHGSPGLSKYNSSHGCIRVYNQAAHWLSKYFIKHGTRVVVTSY